MSRMLVTVSEFEGVVMIVTCGGVQVVMRF